MRKVNIKKILIIISMIIVSLGIILGLMASNELSNMAPTEKVYVDGTDFSGLIQLASEIGSKLIGILFVIYSIMIDLIIWITYGMIWLVIKIIKKIQNKN